MAIATNGGHVSRAIDFLESENKYFIVGGTQVWENKDSEGTEIFTNAGVTDFKLRDVIALKKVEKEHLVVEVKPKEGEDTSKYIRYKDGYWKIVPQSISTTVREDADKGATSIVVDTNAGFSIGDKVRIQYGALNNPNYYDTVIVNKSGSNMLTVEKGTPEKILTNSTVEGGALVEGARYVYLECTLRYDDFPMATFRQIGLCTRVVPRDDLEATNNTDILRAKDYTDTKISNEYTSLGILEILDNRKPNQRSSDQQEQFSLIIEF